MFQQSTYEPQIYVACLASYNAGKLHGEWIDACQDFESIQTNIQTMLKKSPIAEAEEWAIHDFEDFGTLRLSEYEDLEQVHNIACLVQEHGKLGIGLLEHYCYDVTEAQNAFEHYAGCYKSVADFAEEITEETTVIPEQMEGYINYERMAQDLELSGSIYTIEIAYNEIHVFWSY